ncbi:MAG: hypothetical protein JSV02_01995, partial [Dehalococcoidia bacterium]
IAANLEAGNSEGKQTMYQALAKLVIGNMVSREEALMRSSDPMKLSDVIKDLNKALSFSIPSNEPVLS